MLCVCVRAFQSFSCPVLLKCSPVFKFSFFFLQFFFFKIFLHPLPLILLWLFIPVVCPVYKPSIQSLSACRVPLNFPPLFPYTLCEHVSVYVRVCVCSLVWGGVGEALGRTHTHTHTLTSYTDVDSRRKQSCSEIRNCAGFYLFCLRGGERGESCD